MRSNRKGQVFMKKPTVLFPYAEAGMGHIMPMNSIADAFEKKYGERVNIIRSSFFKDSGNPKLIKLEEVMAEQVKKQNRSPKYGYMTTNAMKFFGTHLSMYAMMHWLSIGSVKPGIKYMEELGADMVVSTHWATNFYANKAKHKPITVQYVPDSHINPLFAYNSDLTMISMKSGYDAAMKKYRKYNEKNLKLVPFCIRNEAYQVSRDKGVNRENLGLNPNKFTITLAEGGYGIGKTQAICEEIVKRDLPVTLVPVCGKNEELYSYLKSLKVGENTELVPQGFTTRILEFIAASDLFMGKSGNIIAEPTFFGVPSVITNHATEIEEIIGRYYVEDIGCAVKCFDPSKAADMVEDFIANPDSLIPLQENAKKNADNYGAETTADYIFELLAEKFPEIKEN